jgi:Asp-tRNA(Asn)/Glu-tRNA(Gln) amidotransferase C subunit
MKEFKFHKISEKEKKDIEREAKEIINSFSKKLESIKKLPKEGEVERQLFQRKEKKLKKQKNIKEKNKFKKRILENAPRKNKDYILSEKKKW